MRRARVSVRVITNSGRVRWLVSSRAAVRYYGNYFPFRIDDFHFGDENFFSRPFSVDISKRKIFHKTFARTILTAGFFIPAGGVSSKGCDAMINYDLDLFVSQQQQQQ